LVPSSAAVEAHHGDDAKPSATTPKHEQEGKMQSANSKKLGQPEETREEANLDRRYGEIGISAVAAAVRYRCENKNPAYAPVVHRLSKRDEEALA
jgi:hypothetical protein